MVALLNIKIRSSSWEWQCTHICEKQSCEVFKLLEVLDFTKSSKLLRLSKLTQQISSCDQWHFNIHYLSKRDVSFVKWNIYENWEKHLKNFEFCMVSQHVWCTMEICCFVLRQKFTIAFRQFVILSHLSSVDVYVSIKSVMGKKWTYLFGKRNQMMLSRAFCFFGHLCFQLLLRKRR